MDGAFGRGVFSVSEFIGKGLIDAETFETRSVPELIFDLVRAYE